jgi:hypothetical protein
MVHAKSCACTPCKDTYIMVYIHRISGCNQNPTLFLVWIHNKVECRSWWATHSLLCNLEQPYNFQMHFTQSLKQQNSTTKSPLDLIKVDWCQGAWKELGFWLCTQSAHIPMQLKPLEHNPFLYIYTTIDLTRINHDVHKSTRSLHNLVHNNLTFLLIHLNAT